ncbi:zinc ABC transporter ATP-binding protein ZnuC [Magnetovibrio sp.]|uniref:zinc ABC transporter ATP-binding protein ZnuC n=1 Tax=Magnetovibrio sp. TaxID=2024836 RepID=UPI002F920D53
MTDPSVLIEARGVEVAFGGHTVLSGGDVTVRKGEIVTLIGPNGAGKTTLVRVLLGLVKPSVGKVTRKKGLSIGYMPQRVSIDPALPITVKRFLDLGAPRGLRAEDYTDVLGEVGAGHVMDQPMQGISGGEMQRVLLARAMLRKPDLLVLDEPVQGVDLTGQAELYRLVQNIREQHGVAVLMVSHDLHVVMAQTDHVICLNRHVCCAGHPHAVSRHPEFVALFGDEVASTLAVYAHHHDHEHALDGHVHSESCDHD